MAALGNKIVICGGTDRSLSDCGHVHLLEFGGVNSCSSSKVVCGASEWPRKAAQSLARKYKQS